jgi:hypothetical protein
MRKFFTHSFSLRNAPGNAGDSTNRIALPE